MVEVSITEKEFWAFFVGAGWPRCLQCLIMFVLVWNYKAANEISLLPFVLTILVRFTVSDGHQNNNNNKQQQTAAVLLLDAFKNDPTTSTQFLLAISAAQPITGSSSKQSLFSLRFSQREKFFFRLRSRFLISPGKLFCVYIFSYSMIFHQKNGF